MDFDPDALREGLRPLVPGEPVILTPEEDAYLRHYGIEFTEEFPALAYHFGAVEADEHRIAAHLWMPAEPRGTAVVIHGYYDHTGLYGHLIRHLIDGGFAVVSFDLPGHGLSSGQPATIDTFDHYVDAFEACMRALEHHVPQPWHLIGQSTGGAIAMEWLLGRGHTRESSPFERVVLLAPLVRPHRWPLNRVFYEVARRLVSKRRRTFANNAENPEFLAFLRDRDPLQARVLPVQWVTAMVNWRRRFEAYEPSDIAPLVIQGQADTTVDWRYNMQIIEKLFEPRIFYIPQARHHLVNESREIRAQIFQAIEGELSG
ncbi:MAG: alpha/beta fold hydrolase [Gammaproteobacteria bacterium]|jgi:lysophospholipase|nr:alpha/beta fold hydrolase [Gammaproteobacteria bacterium]